MKKVLIISLYGNYNFGNKLQNYALSTAIKNLDDNILISQLKVRYTSKNIIKNVCKKIILKFIFVKPITKREKVFLEFNDKYMSYTNFVVSNNSLFKNKLNGFDYYIYGSDQIWNPHSCGTSRLYMGYLTNNNISYSASFGVSEIPAKEKEIIKRGLNNFKYISVREDKGKEFVEELTRRNDIDVLIDPTMLLTAEEWDKISFKPKMLRSKKFILNYFLGELSEKRKKEIKKVAKENNCEIINILDQDSPFYDCGPSEFLYLEKNAFLICTDSFHSCVFAVIYNRPFVVFDREENVISMNSRIETLINKFKLKNRKFEGKITKENLDHNYSEAYKILENERKIAKNFLKKSLDIK